MGDRTNVGSILPSFAFFSFVFCLHVHVCVFQLKAEERVWQTAEETRQENHPDFDLGAALSVVEKRSNKQKKTELPHEGEGKMFSPSLNLCCMGTETRLGQIL